MGACSGLYSNWYLHQAGIQYIIHYLIVITPPGSPAGQKCLSILDQVCSALSVPIAEHKRVGPTTCLVFLGIEINTSTFMLCLPTDKLQRLQALLGKVGRPQVPLPQGAGVTHWPSQPCMQGGTFWLLILYLLHSAHHHPAYSSIPICFNTRFRFDLAWWRAFVNKWNGVSFLPAPSHSPTVEMSSDASGSWGCGAWYHNSWFQVPWDRKSQLLPIVSKEIILACATWGHQWGAVGWCVTVTIDQVVVACLRSWTSKHKGLSAPV